MKKDPRWQIQENWSTKSTKSPGLFIFSEENTLGSIRWKRKIWEFFFEHKEALRRKRSGSQNIPKNVNLNQPS